MNYNFIAFVGPTAVGKSDLAIELAKKLNTIIISLDSMQIYKHFDIGTAKLSLSERNNVVHEMIDIVSPSQSFSVEEYSLLAKSLINNYNSIGKVPIVVGGTGLYLKSIINNYSHGNIEPNYLLREELYVLASSTEGKDKLFNLLSEIDIQSAKKLHKNDIRRVIRAIEVFKATGIPISNQKDVDSEYNYLIFALNKDRNELYNNINTRVDKMISLGLIEEVRYLLSNHTNQHSQAMQGIGYKEVVPYLSGNIDLEVAINNIKLNSRRYAKRQITMFKSFKNAHWFNACNKNIIKEIIKIIEAGDIDGN